MLALFIAYLRVSSVVQLGFSVPTRQYNTLMWDVGLMFGVGRVLLYHMTHANNIHVYDMYMESWFDAIQVKTKFFLRSVVGLNKLL